MNKSISSIQPVSTKGRPAVPTARAEDFHATENLQSTVDARCTQGIPVRAAAASITFEFISSVSALRHYSRDLDVLAKAAIEPNVFHEPWMLFPALDAFPRNRELIFVLAHVNSRTKGDSRSQLCGFFPLERRRTYRGLPGPVLTLWRHPYSFLSTPLLKDGYASDVLTAFLSWFRSGDDGFRLLELPYVSASGPFHSSLEHALSHNSGLRYSERLFERALFRPGKDADRYLSEVLSQKKRKEYRRLERRLSDLGKLTWDELRLGGAVSPWIEQFLHLEASGWKGRSGTALAAMANDRKFFATIVRTAHAHGRLRMLALRVDGRAIAMKCNLLAGDGGFAFKIAYDEEFDRFSPGVLLELEQIRRFHNHPRVRWMDSCAAPGHFMANRLWVARKEMRTVLVSAGSRVGNLCIGLIDLIRQLRAWRRRKFSFPPIPCRTSRQMQ